MSFKLQARDTAGINRASHTAKALSKQNEWR